MSAFETYQPIDSWTGQVICAGKATRDLPHSLWRPNALGEIGDTNAFNENTRTLGKLGIGVQELVVTVRKDDRMRDGGNRAQQLVSDWFYGDPELQAELLASGDEDKIRLAAHAAPHDHGIPLLRFAYQGKQYGSGTAVEVGNPEMDGSVILMGDGFMYRADGGSDVKDLIEMIHDQQADGGIITTRVPRIECGKYKYGMIIRDQNGQFERIWEKAPAEAVSGDEETVEANTGIYAMRTSLLRPQLRKLVGMSLEELGTPEYYFTDVPGWMVSAGAKIITLEPKGSFVDCATVKLRDKARVLLGKAPSA